MSSLHATQHLKRPAGVMSAATLDFRVYSVQALHGDRSVICAHGRHAAIQNCWSVAIASPPPMCGVIDSSSADTSSRSTR